MRLLNVKKEVYGERQVEYADGVSKISSMLMKEGEFVSAREGLLKCLEIYKEKLGERNEKYLETLETLSNVYIL
jgi:hypothetical protein